MTAERARSFPRQVGSKSTLLWTYFRSPTLTQPTTLTARPHSVSCAGDARQPVDAEETRIERGRHGQHHPQYCVAAAEPGLFQRSCGFLGMHIFSATNAGCQRILRTRSLRSGLLGIVVCRRRPNACAVQRWCAANATSKRGEQTSQPSKAMRRFP